MTAPAATSPSSPPFPGTASAPAAPPLRTGPRATPVPRASRGRRVWAQSWRVALAALIGILSFAVVWPEIDTTGWSDARLGIGMMGDLAGGLAALVLVVFRRRAPLVVALVLAALAGVSTVATGAAVLALVSLATRRRPREIAAVGVVFLAAAWFSEAAVFPASAGSLPAWQLIIVVVLVYALLIAVGVAIGSRRDLIAALLERARLAEGEQALREERVRDHERSRIAREMHDVLGHRLSLVALHAGALEYRGRELSVDEVVSTAGVVRDNAQSALSELRDVLGVLRDPSATGASEVTEIAPPQPTLADLEGLLVEARAAGTVVTCGVDDATRAQLSDLPTSLGRHAYRIVQESLTNARRHAPGQPVTVALDGAAGESLRIVVRNPSLERRGSAPGHGLTGLAERVRLVGGTFRAGPDGHGSHVVEAVLPWTR